MEQVDTVDIGPLFAGDPAARADCDRALWDALRRTGSVVITGYPEADQVDARARAGLRVFDLAPEVKRPITTALAEPGNSLLYRGYWPCRPDRALKNDYFDVGPEHPEDGPDIDGVSILTEPTPWPDPEPEPGWRATVQAHYDHLNGVAQALILSIGRSAGFAEDAIDARFGGVHSTLRFLNYAAGARNPQTGADGAVLSAGRHVDESGLSLLWQDRPGLQAEGQDGVFRDIPMVPNAISVHVGSVMTGLTRGVVPGTPHRVLACDGPRQSVGFFLEPRLSAPLTPADIPEDQATVRDTYAWQLLRTFATRPQWQGRIRSPEAAA